MNYDAYSFVIDFAFMSMLLILAQFLRAKIKILQAFYIPASVLAGCMGLICGPQVLSIIPWSEKIGSYAYLLICVVFAGLYIGKKETINLKRIFNNVGDTFFINMSTEFICFGSALLIGSLLLKLLFPNVFEEFSLLLPSGFCGGHGYASTIGTTLNNLLERDDCVQIGQTFATLGLLTGLFVGIGCINWAARNGATTYIKKADALPEECRTGIIPIENRTSIGTATISPMSMDPLAWHMSLILLATLFGYKFYYWYKQYLPNIELPIMCLTMLFGVLIQSVLNHTPFRDCVDKNVIDRIGSMLTDYLVAFGIASISITVVKSFLSPIILLCLLGTVWPLIMVFFVGRKLFRDHWFERSIFIFGWCTGVVAIGITLLRICDPSMKSKTLDDYGTAYALISIIEVFIVALTPQLAVSLGCTVVGTIELMIGVGLLLTCAKLYGIRKGKLSDICKKHEG